MGYGLNRLDEPVFMAGPKPMQTEFGIHQRLESCEMYLKQKARQGKKAQLLLQTLLMLLGLWNKRTKYWFSVFLPSYSGEKEKAD